MTRAIKSWRVSELTSEHALEFSERNATSTYASWQLKGFAAEVNKALRGVNFHYHTPNTAIVYRPGEIHALGEIGYKNTKTKGAAEMVYYVAARGITNAKYRSSSWQHHIVSSKVLKTAVAAAATHLKPYTCEESASETVELARSLVAATRSAKLVPARMAYKDFIGATAYSDSFQTDLITELRGHTFALSSLNEASAKFYACLDEWEDGEKAVKNGMYYVGLIDNGGQQIVDTAHATFGYPMAITCYSRGFYDEAPDWVKGRVAVLSMVEPNTYVQGVGLRIDDRIFYVLGDSN